MTLRNDVEVFISKAVETSREIQLFDQMFVDESSSFWYESFPETTRLLKLALKKSIVLNICAFFDPPSAAKKQTGDNLSLPYILQNYSTELGADGIATADRAIEIFKKLDFNVLRSKFFAHADVGHYTSGENPKDNASTEALLEVCRCLIDVGLRVDNPTGSLTTIKLLTDSRLIPPDNGSFLNGLLRASLKAR